VQEVALDRLQDRRPKDLLRRERGMSTMSPTEFRAAITVNRTVAVVFDFWHDVQNLPRFLEQLQSVRDLGGGRSRWRQADQTGAEIEFDVELTAHEVDERVAWRSLDDGEDGSSGEVTFTVAPGERGTEVRAVVRQLTAGRGLGATAAALLGADDGDDQLRNDLRRFKQLLETGEVVRSEARPEGTSATELASQRPAQPLPA
jgi:uncharacterized membrane protein